MRFFAPVCNWLKSIDTHPRVCYNIITAFAGNDKIGEMMKRSKIGIIVAIVMLCLASVGLSACAKEPRRFTTGDPPEHDRLPSVTALKAIGTADGVIASWNAVGGATEYVVTCCGGTAVTAQTTVNLSKCTEFVLPDDGEITITVAARAEGYIDSLPTSIKYVMEVKQLRSPEIIAFNNGVIEWKADSGVSTFILKINNEFVSDASDYYYHTNKYDTKNLTVDSRIDIVAVAGSGERDSAPTSFMYSAAKKRLTVLPVSEYEIADETLKWGAIGGAVAYRVVDLDFNVTTVEDTYFDMSRKNLVYGVYPVMNDDALMGSAEITPTSIGYLSGGGTAQDPYLIKTPFDLRAIDYYELRRSETNGVRRYYRIENDMDYNAVNALESDSNIYTLRKPFNGTLDGNGKKLSNIRVNYDGGFWALFEFLERGAVVTNVTFDGAEIYNRVQDDEHPLNASIATVAYMNYGTVSGVTVVGAQYTAMGGEVCGIVAHNYGTVSGCSVSGTFAQAGTSALGVAGYEMAGVVLENLNGGTVEDNTVGSLTLRGTGGNIRSAAGVVSINREGGIVRNNSYTSVVITGMAASGSEYGGVTAYCAGTTTKGTGKLGTFTVGGVAVTVEMGGADGRGKLVGKRG